MIIDSEVSALWLRRWYECSELTYSRIAGAVDKDRGQVHHWIKGKFGIKLSSLVELIVYFYEEGAIGEIGELRKALADFGLDMADFEAAVKQCSRQWKGAELVEALKEASASFRVIGKVLPSSKSVARPELREEIRAGLLDPEARAVVLWGMGGIGKTVLVEQLMQVPEIQVEFWNGVLYTSLGPQPEIGVALKLWARALKLPLSPQDTREDLQARVRDYLADPTKRYLIIVDDVWDREALSWFGGLIGGDSRLLVTTRNRNVAAALGQPQVIEVPPMGQLEALELLRLEVGKARITSELLEHGAELVDLLGRIPLAVMLLGRQVKQWGWDYMLSRMWDRKARLDALTADPREKLYLRYRDTSVRFMLDLSYELLDAEYQRDFRSLNVFPYSQPFAPLNVGWFWGLGTEGSDIKDIIALAEIHLNYLHNQGLLEIRRDAKGVIFYTLHTVVHDYARSRCATTELVEMQTQYIDVWLRALYGLQSQRIMETPFANTAQAFAYALELEWYVQAAYLLSQTAVQLVSQVRFDTYRQWLAALEAQREALSAAARGELDYAQLRLAYALRDEAAIQQYHEQLLTNPEAGSGRKKDARILQLTYAMQRGVHPAGIPDMNVGELLTEDPRIKGPVRVLALKQQGRLLEAAILCDEIVSQAAEERDFELLFQSLELKSDIHIELGQFEPALDTLQETVYLAHNLGRFASEWNALTRVLEFWLRLGRPDDVFAAEERLVELLEQMGLTAAETAARKSFLFQNFARAALLKQDVKLARLWCLKSLEQARRSADLEELATAHHLLGDIYVQQGNRKAAAEAYLESIPLCEELGRAERAQLLRAQIRELGDS